MTNYIADRMVLAGTGGVDHASLVQLAEKHFSSLLVAQLTALGRALYPKTDFVGADVRIRDDTMPTVNFARAVEGVGWSSPDYFPMPVLHSVFGNWDRSLGASPLLSSHHLREQPRKLIHELLDLVLGHGSVEDLFRLGELGRPGALHAPRVDALEHRDGRG